MRGNRRPQGAGRVERNPAGATKTQRAGRGTRPRRKIGVGNVVRFNLSVALGYEGDARSWASTCVSFEPSRGSSRVAGSNAVSRRVRVGSQGRCERDRQSSRLWGPPAIEAGARRMPALLDQ